MELGRVKPNGSFYQASFIRYYAAFSINKASSMDSPSEADWLVEEPFGFSHEVKDSVVICSEKPNCIETVENFWLVILIGAKCEKPVCTHGDSATVNLLTRASEVSWDTWRWFDVTNRCLGAICVRLFRSSTVFWGTSHLTFLVRHSRSLVLQLENKWRSVSIPLLCSDAIQLHKGCSIMSSIQACSTRSLDFSRLIKPVSQGNPDRQTRHEDSVLQEPSTTF